jgi:cysteine-rich repeat protein
MKRNMILAGIFVFGLVLTLGISFGFLFNEIEDFTDYLFLGELTGKVASSDCETFGGSCQEECSSKQYESKASCSGSDLTNPTGNAISPTEEDICCMSDTCGNGIQGVAEECDDGNTEDNDGCSSECIIELASTCGDGTCDSDETCSSCISDCVSIVGEPACSEGQTCEEDFGVGTCSVAAPESCGDSVISGEEECDDGEQNGVSCDANYGETCNYCSQSCANVILEGSSCGDSIIDSDNLEVCDLSNLSYSSCENLGFISGTLTCSHDCLTFDTSSCSNNPLVVGIENPSSSSGPTRNIESNETLENLSNLELNSGDDSSDEPNYYGSEGNSNEKKESEKTSSDEGTTLDEIFWSNEFSPKAIGAEVAKVFSSKWGIPIGIVVLVVLILIILSILKNFKITLRKKKRRVVKRLNRSINHKIRKSVAKKKPQKRRRNK